MNSIYDMRDCPNKEKNKCKAFMSGYKIRCLFNNGKICMVDSMIKDLEESKNEK